MPSNTRAGNINTIDEVPDSSWFTNRIGSQPMTDAEIARGRQLGHAAGAGEVGAAPREVGRHQSRLHRTRRQRRDLVPAVRLIPSIPRAAPAPSRSRRSCSGRSATTRSRRSSPRFDPGARRDRSEGDGASGPRASARRSRTTTSRRGARAGGAQRRRHLSRVGRPAASREGPRAVPLRGHALRRSERHRAARASPRAARAARLRRLDEPGRLEGRQHARHAGRRKRPRRS